MAAKCTPEIDTARARLYHLVLFRVYVVFGMVLLGAVPCAVHAEDASPIPTVTRSYPLPRYEEKWKFLRDFSQRKDFWDPVKFIKLADAGNVYLSIGGEARESYERFHDPDFGASPPDPAGYLLQRYLLHLDLHASSRFRFFGELSSSLENWRTGGPRPVVDEDKLDVHQGFFDFSLGKSADRAVLRVGRQEIALGSGRLIALREGTNVPFSFDGFRVSVHTGSWQLDGFATRPVANNPGIFDDPPQHSYSFWGFYSAGSFGSRRPNFDIYYLGLDRKSSRFNQGIAREARHTVGARTWGQLGRWTYDYEAMYQVGSFGTGDIRAWRLASDTSYTFRSTVWRPRVGFIADVASGDKDPSQNDLQTFNALFQSGTYSGKAQILGPANTIRAEPSIGLLLSEHVSFSAGWGFYWRESVHDGLYGIAGNLLVPSNGATARYEGSRPIAQLDWEETPHLSWHVNYIYVFNGPFEKQAVHGPSSLSFVSPWVTYRF